MIPPWPQVKAGSIFDNIIVTDDVETALQFAKDTWGKSKDKGELMQPDGALGAPGVVIFIPRARRRAWLWRAQIPYRELEMVGRLSVGDMLVLPALLV